MKYLKEEDIVKDKIKLSKAHINLDGYDMYYVEFLMKTGETRIVRVFCEKGTFPEFHSTDYEKLIKNYGPKLPFNFFAERLIGKQGLMNKEGREDFIYLGGELYKNGYIANRYMMQSNGKTGQENFDKNLFNIKLQVQAKENNSKNNLDENNGKTYVVGDIHGMYGSYMEIINRMTSKDHLIILGDVIDRGNGGIEIIQDIMKRKEKKQNNPDITFILGNHEMQFLESVAIMIKRGLSKKDIINIMDRVYARSKYGYHKLHSDSNSKKSQKEWKEKIESLEVNYRKLVEEKGLTKWESDVIGIWLNWNGGSATIFDFLKDEHANGEKKQLDIYAFLSDSYVALPKNINGKDYLFVHAMPPKDFQMLNQMKKSKKGYTFSELSRPQRNFMLEEREKSTYEQAKKLGFTTICGHTPEYGEIIIDNKKGFIRIDTGCGHKQNKSKLALYCVDNGKVEYFDEKESIQEKQQL